MLRRRWGLSTPGGCSGWWRRAGRRRSGGTSPHHHHHHLRMFFKAWKEEVVRVVPAERLLVWQVKDGWAPLCQVGLAPPSSPP